MTRNRTEELLCGGELLIRRPDHPGRKKPKVSVICTAYNHGPYIRCCLESIYSQITSFPFEVIINDDASTDGTKSVIEEFESRFPENTVCFYWNVNQYSDKSKCLASARKNLSEARGEYVALCECDDYFIDNYKLQKQFDLLESGFYVAAIHNAKRVDEFGNDLHELRSPYVKKRVQTTADMLENIGQMYSLNSLMFRSDAPVMGEMRKYFSVGDIPLALELSLFGDIYFDERIMSAYRVMAGGSWSERMKGDIGARLQYIDSTIEGMRFFDEDTNGAFRDKVNEVIQSYRRDRLIALRSPKAIIAVLNDPILAKRPLRVRLRTLFSACLRLLRLR